MSDFLRIVTDAISDLKKSPEYEPGKEISIVVPMKSKNGTLKGVPLDDAKISYLDDARQVLRDGHGEVILDLINSGFVVCRVTGKIR